MAMFMDRFQGETYALVRIVFGLLFLSHGLQKLVGWPLPMPEGFAMTPLVWAAGAIESVGGALIAIGFQTRWAAFLCSGQMAVAYWMAHGLRHWHPNVNQGELAVLYCFAFLCIAAHGAGIWSVDGGARSA
ncbi:MAG TPA: DoxX family protein [Myxococcota bacterium]|jgi:putative oxidoreductase|nr:DoxX family protein [Myxococcota bacterium]